MMGIIALDSAWKDESFEPKYKNLATLFPEKNVSIGEQKRISSWGHRI